MRLSEVNILSHKVLEVKSSALLRVKNEMNEVSQTPNFTIFA
ncbi:MAG: hypothetical protein ACLFPL_00005 [Candidatus Nanoarchaeia archaeon]